MIKPTRKWKKKNNSAISRMKPFFRDCDTSLFLLPNSRTIKHETDRYAMHLNDSQLLSWTHIKAGSAF